MSELKVQTYSYRITIMGASEFYYGMIAKLKDDLLVLEDGCGSLVFICKMKDVDLFQRIPDPSFVKS